MQMIVSSLTALSDALWGTPMIVILLGTGLYLSIRFRFRYNFRSYAFHFRNTFGRMFAHGEGQGTVSGFAAACTAMANTIGVREYWWRGNGNCIRRSWSCFLDVGLRLFGDVHESV